MNNMINTFRYLEHERSLLGIEFFAMDTFDFLISITRLRQCIHIQSRIYVFTEEIQGDTCNILHGTHLHAGDE